MWEYTKKTKELFRHPKNAGEIKDADAVGEVGSMICGDALRLFLKVDKETGKITDARFQTFGCASAIASSSALTEMIKGMTLDEAQKVSNKDIADFLGGLPKEKMHCSVMGWEALEAAILDYKGEAPTPRTRGRIVCECFQVSEETIREVALANRLTTVEEITGYTKAGGGCGSCVEEIETILRDIWHVKAPFKMPAEPKRLTNLQRIALIQDALEKDIRPPLQAEGGDLELIDIEGRKVTIALRRAGKGDGGEVTVEGIEERLRELVGDEITVESV